MIPDTFIALAMPVGLMLAGILLLIKGGDWTVNASVYVAKKFGISPLVVGFTIIAFGTSLPELVISLLANFDGSPGIALGNVIGSNIANVLLVIG
ncbi:MAG: sodium:calcium antiporter, partial [Alphaproteobacteria bacterium]